MSSVRRSLDKIEIDTPFMLIDPFSVIDKYEQLALLLPKHARIHYAVKSNASACIIRALRDVGARFEVASIGELRLLARQGVPATSAIFSNPVKIPSHISEAAAHGVRYFSFDSETELLKIAACAPGSHVFVRLGVSNAGSDFNLSERYGTTAEQAVVLLKRTRRLGLVPAGLAFHVGSQSKLVSQWSNALAICNAVLNRLLDYNVRLEFINVGGGFPADYGYPIPNLREITETINQATESLPYDVQLLAEPGRFLVAESAVIATSIIGKKAIGTEEWIFLDMGVFQGLMEPLEMPSWKYPLFCSPAYDAQAKKIYVLTGPTCDPYDILDRSAELPAGLGLGDRIYIGCAGAYTSCYESTFNGFSPPKVITIKHATSVAKGVSL